jgi:ADP-heptose:LPS heptosyltransferase
VESMKRVDRSPDLSSVDDIESILIVRLKALGDIALSLPIPRALRERYPEARISYLCWERFAEALKGESSVDEVLPLKRGLLSQVGMMKRLWGRRFDLAIDLIGSPRSALITFITGAGIRIGMDVGRHTWCYHYLLPRVLTVGGRRVKCYTLDSNREIVRMLSLWGVGGLKKGPGMESVSDDRGTDSCAIGFPAAETESDWAEDYMDGLGIDRGRIIGIVPSATYQSKSWPREKFVRLAEILMQQHGLVPLILWGPGEQETAQWVARSVPGAICAPETGIAKLGALISRVRLLVTTDSGPKHLAVLQGVPTVTLFGPTDPVIWDPMNERHGVLFLDLPCAPCRKLGCDPNRCLSDIETEDVVSRIADILCLDERSDQHTEDSQ